MTQQYDDEDIVMVIRKSQNAENEINTIIQWCEINSVIAEFLSVHRYHLKFGLKDPLHRTMFILAWHSSIVR